MLNADPNPVNTQDSSTNTDYTILKNPENEFKHLEVKTPKLRELIPYHIRLNNYLERKNAIFQNFQQFPLSKRILNARSRYKKRKSERKFIASSTISFENDMRPHLKVHIQNKPLTGLLDSGASVSCLGKDCLSFVEELKIPIIDIFDSIKTADGKPQRIVGKVKVEIKCNDISKSIILYLVPTLSQNLYLGIDFWNLFDLKPCFVNKSLKLEEISLSNSDSNFEKFRIESNNPDTFDEKEKIIYPMHELSQEQQVALEKAKSNFRCYTKFGLGKTTLEEHQIDTGDAPPKKMRFYPISPAVQALIYEELDRMMSLKVIEPAIAASWNNPMTLVRKPGKNRLCLDARELNKVTLKDAYPLPNINNLLSRLGDTHFISAVDLKDAFWQIPLSESSRPKTAFTVPGRPHYQFTVMPFGLCNAAQRLCRLMDKVVPSELKDRVFVYLDDLLIVSPTFDLHMEILKIVGEKLSNAGLTINMQKSNFCFKELKYLGYIVGGGKLKQDPNKTAAIVNMPYPKTPKEVKRFIGVIGWYRRFIPDCATLMAPITETLKKNKIFEFGPSAIEKFNEVKQILVSFPILVSPNFEKHFYIQCDASNVGIGAVIFQKDDEGGEHPIEFFSEKLNKAQQNYTVSEKECLAVIRAIEKFRHYIDLMPFTVITDHSSLKWLMSQKDLCGRLGRWSLRIQRFSFDIVHRKGSQNVVPDMLSRIEEICEITTEP